MTNHHLYYKEKSELNITHAEKAKFNCLKKIDG